MKRRISLLPSLRHVGMQTAILLLLTPGNVGKDDCALCYVLKEDRQLSVERPCTASATLFLVLYGLSQDGSLGLKKITENTTEKHYPLEGHELL
eukprot:1576007-Amphidinium_carterae.1